MGFPDGTVVKNPSANAGDSSDARSGRSPGVEMATQFHGQRNLTV